MQQQVGRIRRLKIRVGADVIQLPCSSPQLHFSALLCEWRPVPLCQSMQSLQNVLQHTQRQCKTTAVTERLLAAFVLS
jgi:hypothetical protein